MKRSLALLFLLAVPASLIFGGIKAKTSPITYAVHDRMSGLRALESAAGHPIAVEWSQTNSTPAFVGGRLTQTGYSTPSTSAEDGIRFIAANKALFGINDPSSELRAVSTFTDGLAMTHVKYEQRIGGIRVYYSGIIVHFNSDGSVESVNGAYVPTPLVAATPKITADAALLCAKKAIDYVPSSAQAELIIYQVSNMPMLAYEVSLPGTDFPKMTAFIDAETGTVIKVDNGLRYDGAAKGTGLGFDGKVKSIDTYLSGGKYYLIDASLPMYVPPIDSLKGVIETYNAYNDTAGNGYQKAVFVTDPNGDDNFNDNENLKAAVSAHLLSKTVYNFYRSHYNRNSYDNRGGSITNVVHFKDKYNNAFWNGSFMSYGDGDGVKFSQFAGALDVIGHEITHGVVSSTADLVYELQSGAINESIADVFGALIDSTNWLIGEDAYTPAIAGDAIRSMSDPHNGRATDDVNNGWQPATMSEFRTYPNDDAHDNGGVHVNSGILNKAFYNAATAIGRWEAGQIWYRSLTVYLTKNSQFADLRIACLSAAKDLYGLSSAEYNAVSDAFTAVGLVPPPVYTSTDLVYDDGDPSASVYEDYPYWQLGVRFSPPMKNYNVTQIQVYTAGDKYNGTGQYKLGMYKADSTTGLPWQAWYGPSNQIPSGTGWQIYNLKGGGTYSYDFYVTVLYDGAGTPLIGADPPPGNGKAYEYDLTKHAWVKLEAPNDYTLFMRATVKSTTSVAEIDTKVPSVFSLEQNYPNPFNPSTTVRYALPEGCDVRVIVYDQKGSRVAELVNNYQLAGTYAVTWNGVNDAGQHAASGVYYYKINAGGFEKTNKMVLLR